MELSLLCLRAGVTRHLWFYGRNMRILGAEMDQEAGTALVKCVLLMENGRQSEELVRIGFGI